MGPINFKKGRELDTPQEYMARYVRADRSFMDGCYAGLQAVREGRFRAWGEVKREQEVGREKE